MKKVLLASTALVFAGGMAFAEVSVSGDGEFGVINNGGADGDDLAFTTDVGFSFSGTGETDGGISFGGSLDADSTSDNGSSGTVFVEGGFGKLTVGDTDSAADAAVGGLSGIGLTGLESDVTFLGAGDGPTALYEVSLGDATIYVSVSNPGATIDDDMDAETAEVDADTDFSIGADYSMGNYTFAIGYEDVDDADHTVGSVSGAFGPATVKVIYGNLSPATGESDDQFGASVDYVAGVTTITGYYLSAFGDDTDEYGVGVAYDLGGGAVLQAGVLDGDAIDDTMYDFGISLSF